MPPCDSISVMSVSEELKNVDRDVLQKALESMGFTVPENRAGLTYSGYHKETGQYYTGSYLNGKLNQQVQYGSPKLDINQVKVAYSHQVVQKAAGPGAYKWKLTKTGKDTYTAQKG